MTYAEVLVEAASAHLADLPPPFETAPPASVGDADSGGSSSPRAGAQVQLWLDGRQLRLLDDQVTRLQAPSYTALVLALLRADPRRAAVLGGSRGQEGPGQSLGSVSAPSG